MTLLDELNDTIILSQIERMKGKDGKKAIPFKDGWMFSIEFHHFQKVNGEVYVYLTRQGWGRWIVQAYQRKTIGLCTLEAWMNDPTQVDKLFYLAEKWLDMYQHGFDNVEDDPYYIAYRDGWQGRDLENKELFY